MEIVKGERVANEYMEYLVSLSHDLHYSEMDKLSERFAYFASYRIRGNVLSPSKFTVYRGGRGFGVAIIPIDLATFCAKTFMRERENHSDAIDLCDYPDDVFRRIDELFPRLSVIAN